MLKIELEKENEELKEQLAKAIEVNEAIVKSATESDQKREALSLKLIGAFDKYETEKNKSKLLRSAIDSCANKVNTLTDKVFQLQESKTLYETDHTSYPPVERVREKVDAQEVEWSVFYNQLAGAVTSARDICFRELGE